MELNSQIKFVHEYFEQLSVEADNKLLDSNLHKPSQLEIAKSLPKNYEIFRPRRGKGEWPWLHEASKCYHIHLRNASFYHQFLKNLKVLANEVEGVKESCSRLKENEDVFRASENTRNLLEKLLELQFEVEKVQEMSHRVVPIHLRRLPCQPQRPQPITSIGSYYDVDDKLIEENSDFYLLDNSDARRWKVRNNKFQELHAPSLLFIIPHPDAGLMQEAYKLRWHLVSVWRFCVEEAKKDLKNLLTTQLDKGQTFELQQLASIHKKQILETLNAAKNLLSNGDRRMADDIHEINNKILKLQDYLSDQRYNSGIRSNSPLSKEWSGHHNLAENIKEMEVYLTTYSGNVASQVCSQNHLVGQDENDKPRFKSSAYIQRWTEHRANPSPKLMMIYEAGNSPGFTSNLRGEVKEVVVEEEEHVEETQFTSQTIKETQRFFIRGVFDPRTGRNISNQQAIDSGIIDLKRGVYRNTVSGEDILIAEAMNRGLIAVEYSNKTVEMGELIKSGIFKTFGKKEVVSYVILSIKDPRGGKNVSVADALSSGLIDQEQGRFILDKESGDAISIESAIEKGFLEVKELNRHPIVKEEPSNVKVIGVYDIVGKHFVQLQQALRRDVMDKNTAALRNKVTGEVIPLKEAVRRGLVLLEISPGNDSNSLKNFPVLKQEDFDEIMEGVAEGYSADPIVELMSEVSDDSLFYDPSNNEQISLKRAMISSRVGFNPLMVTLHDGTKCSLQGALLRGILDLKGVDELLKVTGGKRSLLKLVEDERLDLKTGDYVDLATKQRKSLEDAVQGKQLNPSLLFYWDDQSQVATSLKASLDNGRLKNGKVFDFKSNVWLTMEEAVDSGLIDLEVNSDQLVDKCCSLVLFKDLINDGNEPVLIKGQPLEDAIMEGKLDVGGLQISSGGEGFVSLPSAVNKHLIDPDAARRIADVARKNDLNSFFVSHKTFDPSTSRIEHPTTGRKITFLQAVNDGVINPNSVFMVDCTDDGVKSMKRLAAEGKFNLETGKFKDAKTGRERSVLDAIKNRLVKSSIDPDAYLEQSRTIESILEKDSKNKFIELKNGDRMELKEAIAAGFVDPTTKFKVDGVSGKLVFDDETDGEVLTCLREVSSLDRLLDRFKNDFHSLKDSRNPDLNEFDNFRNKLGAFKSDVDKVFGGFDYVDSSATNTKNFDKLKTAANKLQTNFQKLEDDLDAEINKRGHVKRRTSQVLDKLIGLKEGVAELEDEFRALKQHASDPNVNLNFVIQRAQDLDAKLQMKLEELPDAESCCEDLMEFLRSSDNNSGVHTNNENVSRVDKTLKDIDGSLNKINSNFQQFISDLSNASHNHDEFSELEELFLNKLVSTENEIASLENSEGKAPTERIVVLRELSDIESVLLELESLRKDLEQLGKEVDSSLKKLGRVSKCEVMRADDLERMKIGVNALQNKINKSMSEDENKKSRLLRIGDFVSDLERTSGAEQLSLDRKKLLQLSDSIQKRRRDIDSLRSELSDAFSSAPQNDAAADDDDDLMERLQQIDDKLQNKEKKINGLSDLLKQFYESKESMGSWMKGFATRVNKKDDSRILRIKIPKLSEEMSSKEGDLKRLNVIGGELMTPNEVTDRAVIHNDLLELNRKWDDITNLIANYIIFGASGEIEKLMRHLDATESKLISTEPLNINRDQLADQLKSHQKFHSDLLSKKSSADEVVNEYSWWLCHVLGDEGDDVRMKLDAITERLNAVSQSSMSRLICLEDAVTLATHFDQSLSDLKLWISEMEADVTSTETKVTKVNNSEQSNKLQEHVKAKNHEINDHFELMEILKGTGLELKELCDEKGASFIDSQVSRLSERYDRIRDTNRGCLQRLQEAVYNSNDEAYNLLSNIRNDLNFYEQMLSLNFRPSLSQPVLLGQINDLQTMHDDTLKIAHIIGQVQQELTANNSMEELQLLERLSEKEKDLESKVATKKDELENILRLVEEFENVYTGIMSSLQTIQDNLTSQDYPGIEASVVSDQINELNMMEEDLHNVRDMFRTCDELVNGISDVCDKSIVVELKKLLNNRDHIFGNVLEGLSIRRLDLHAASDLSQKYGQHLENVASWLPVAESRSSKVLKAKSAIRSLDPSDVDRQLCDLKRELMLSYEDVIRLKDVLSSFKIISPLSTDVLSFEVNDIETRFHSLLSTINNNFNNQNVDQLELLQNLINRISSEQLNAKEQAWNAKLLKSELNRLDGDYFNNNPVDTVPSHQLLMACKECQARAANLKDKQLLVENLFKWFDGFKNDLVFLRALRSQSAPLKAQAEHFEKRNKEFEEKMKEAEGVLNEVKSMEGGIGADYLVNMLHENVSNSGALSEETEQKLKEHAEDVEIFHSLIGEHSQKMNELETSLAQQPMKNPPSDLERDLLSEKLRLEDVARHGSNLKFFGRKQDSLAINSALLNAELRWNQLFRRLNGVKMKSSEDENQKEKFVQQYNDLAKSFEEIEKKVNDKSLLKDLMILEDEMSASEKKMHALNHTLRNMETAPDGLDNDLHSMVQDLKKKWNKVHNSLISKKNKLDLDLISSGKVTEAIKVQCNWLLKCIEYLDENQPLLGDLDTVSMLIDQYKNFQEDLKMHNSLIESIRSSNPPKSSIEELNSLWKEVNKLNETRKEKLQESHGLASEFQEAVEKVRRMLPEIEDGLKESGTNVQTEEQLLGIIDHQQKLYSKLCDEQPIMERIVFMSDEILENCHPSATRFMQYYLTITQKRWEQALMKSNNLLEKLNESLKKFRGGATVVEDLWAWLSEAQQLLVTKNKDPPPLDLATVDALIRDHQDFHEDLINKNEEIEEIVCDVQSTPLSKNHIQTLQNKWRSVWRLSVERKKMLQETIDYLLEMESLNNFNFDEWRQRYNDWIRAKKLRVTDFFRKEDVQGYGTLTRNQFVNGMISSKFPSNRMELNAVFDLFEDPSTGEMLYQLLIEALKSDKMVVQQGLRSAKTGNPSKRVDDEVVTQISRCQCRKQFAAYKMSEGKYQFGEKGRMYLLRFVNGAVMVRVGGGWVSLMEFLQLNDPCRAKNRTNMEIYKTLQDGRKSTSSLNKSASGSATSLNLSNQQTPKRSRTPQTTSLMKKKNAPLNHSMTSLVSLKSKDSDQQNVNKSADSLKSPKQPGPRSSFVPPKRMSTPKAEQPRDIKRPTVAIRPPSQR